MGYKDSLCQATRQITSMARAVLLFAIASCSALQLPVPPRREVLRLGAAAIVVPVAPAFAKTKASLNPNKQEGVGASAKDYQSKMYAEQKAQMAGDKGSRGVASAQFEETDTVQRNR